MRNSPASGQNMPVPVPSRKVNRSCPSSTSGPSLSKAKPKPKGHVQCKPRFDRCALAAVTDRTA